MKIIEAYRCQWCGKVYISKWRCEAHEAKADSRTDGCKAHPSNKAKCYSCRHYSSEKLEVTHAKMEDERSPRPFRKDFTSPRCMKRGRFLVNGFHLCEDWVTQLEEFYGYDEMPTEASGCEDYEEYL